jgi:hypothetical protein
MLRPGEIVLLDTIGELASVYSLASVAFVGGSLVPAGGHNPLEPAQFAVPIVIGPHYANFAAIVDSLRSHDALRIAAKEELGSVLIELLGNRTASKAMGRRAKEVFDSEAGATDRCVEAIRDLLHVPKQQFRGENPADHAIFSEVRRLNEQGKGIDTILAFLRSNGKNPIESLAVLRSDLAMGLSEAKTAIYESEVWRDAREAMDDEIEQLTDGVPHENDHPNDHPGGESKG